MRRRRRNPSGRKLLVLGAVGAAAYWLLRPKPQVQAVTPKAGTSGNQWPYFTTFPNGQTAQGSPNPFGSPAGAL